MQGTRFELLRFLQNYTKYYKLASKNCWFLIILGVIIKHGKILIIKLITEIIEKLKDCAEFNDQYICRKYMVHIVN